VAAPATIATPVARRMPAWSRRPTACPTRTEAAAEMPSGTMKESEARLSVSWWPATCVAPIEPIVTVTKAKAPISMRYITPMGSPRRSCLSSSGQRAASRRTGRR
jgi:hypothetical protein